MSPTQEEKDQRAEERAAALAQKRQEVQSYLHDNPFPYQLGDETFVNDVVNNALAEDPEALVAFQTGAWSTAASKLSPEVRRLLDAFTPHAFEA